MYLDASKLPRLVRLVEKNASH